MGPKNHDLKAGVKINLFLSWLLDIFVTVTEKLTNKTSNMKLPSLTPTVGINLDTKDTGSLNPNKCTDQVP